MYVIPHSPMSYAHNLKKVIIQTHIISYHAMSYDHSMSYDHAMSYAHSMSYAILGAYSSLMIFFLCAPVLYF